MRNTSNLAESFQSYVMTKLAQKVPIFLYILELGKIVHQHLLDFTMRKKEIFLIRKKYVSSSY